MSRIFFSMQTFSPNLKSTYFKHVNFVKYIAESEYVARNPNTKHGLFGNIEGIDKIEEKQSIRDVEEHIKRLAENKRVIHRGLISMRECDAQRLGYLEQEKWQDIFIKQINDFSKMLNVPIDRIQYIASVHIQKGHPHCHFMMWDSREEVREPKIPVKEKNKMRIKIINSVFKEDLMPYYQQKDLIKKDIKQSKIIQDLIDLSYDENFIRTVKQLEDNFYSHKIKYNQIRDENLKEIVKELIKLKDKLPKRGRLAYQYLSKEEKEEVDKIAKMILKSSQECKSQLNKYIEISKTIKSYQITNKEKLHGELEKVEKNAEYEIMKILGNRVLQFEKNLMKNVNVSSITIENNTKTLLDNILLSLSQLNSSKYADYYKIKNYGELSRQAKKEKMLEESAKSSFEWESDVK